MKKFYLFLALMCSTAFLKVSPPIFRTHDFALVEYRSGFLSPDCVWVTRIPSFPELVRRVKLHGRTGGDSEQFWNAVYYRKKGESGEWYHVAEKQVGEDKTFLSILQDAVLSRS